MLNIILASPRGFCAGVERAIETVKKTISHYGSPVYVRHEIVHNKYVVAELKQLGAIFVDEIDKIPKGSVVIFSAHGVSEKVEKDAIDHDLHIIDATCPLVTKVHIEAKNVEKSGKELILIGHKGHPEVEGTSGRVKNKVLIISTIEEIEIIKVKDPENLAYVTQTTLSVDDTAKIIQKLKDKFPKITGPELKDICYATQNRQNAVKELAKKVDLLLVIGSSNSSNSNRLKDLGLELCQKAYLINDENDIDLSWFDNVSYVGVTAGASAPEAIVQNVTYFLAQKFGAKISNLTDKEENIHFKLPLIIS